MTAIRKIRYKVTSRMHCLTPPRAIAIAGVGGGRRRSFEDDTLAAMPRDKRRQVRGLRADEVVQSDD